MQQKNSFKVEVWLDGHFYDKLAVNTDNYNLGKIIEQIKSRMAAGIIPFAERIEIRQARI